MKMIADFLISYMFLRPLIEMCIPSSLDPTIAPPNCHVMSLFTQYTPYSPKGYSTDGRGWNKKGKEKYTELGNHDNA